MSPLLRFFADEDDDIEFVLMLRQFERISDVREILDVMPQQNVVFWTMVAVGYAHLRRPKEVVEVFRWIHT